MSRLTQYLHNHYNRQLISGIVGYLDTNIALTGDEKKTIALAVVLGLHKSVTFTTALDPAIEAMIGEAIDAVVNYEHGIVERWLHPVTTPTQDLYRRNLLAKPHDSDLKSGDTVYYFAPGTTPIGELWWVEPAGSTDPEPKGYTSKYVIA
jgi:hypothetical protein